MLPVPLILAVVMAGAVLVIMFLLFQHLGKQEKDLGKHSLGMSSLKEEVAQKDEEIKKTSVVKEQLQQELRTSKEEADNLRKEFTVRDRLYQQFKAKCAQLEEQVAGKKDMAAQLEQQKKQFMEQVIKCKNLEKDLQVRQDEITNLEQEKRRQEAVKEGERKKEAKGVAKAEPEGAQQEQPKPEGPQQEEAKPQGTEGEQAKKEDSPFKRFLKPKISEKSQEEEHKSEDPREPGQ